MEADKKRLASDTARAANTNLAEELRRDSKISQGSGGREGARTTSSQKSMTGDAVDNPFKKRAKLIKQPFRPTKSCYSAVRIPTPFRPFWNRYHQREARLRDRCGSLGFRR